MPAFVDLSGHRYGRLTVIREAGRKHGGVTWLVRCDCGNEKVMRSNSLRRGHSKSCGCLNTETRRRVCIERNTKHGLSSTKAFDTWVNIRQRCKNPSTTSYKKYGARGIHVCERWMKFENFLADMGVPPTPQHTIDRIDPKGPYSPENCRWATQQEQQNNRSNNRKIFAFGRTQNFLQWCREFGIHHKTVSTRIKLGWNIEQALSVKSVKGRNQYGNHPFQSDSH